MLSQPDTHRRSLCCCAENSPLRSARGRSVSQEVWTIWRGREFVGTIPYLPNESAQELEARALVWLAPLLS
jgi:hypothetical protein